MMSVPRLPIYSYDVIVLGCTCLQRYLRINSLENNPP